MNEKHNVTKSNSTLRPLRVLLGVLDSKVVFQEWVTILISPTSSKDVVFAFVSQQVSVLRSSGRLSESHLLVHSSLVIGTRSFMSLVQLLMSNISV